MTNRRVLYLDDEQNEVSQVADRLEIELGITVTLANSVSAAIEELRSNSYALVIVDIMMAVDKMITWDDSGFRLIELILSDEFSSAGNNRFTPIVIASAVWDSFVERRDGSAQTVRDIAHEYQIPVARLVQKPWPSDDEGSLKEAVGRILGDEGAPD